MPKVKAKFMCNSTEKHAYGGTTANLTAVHSEKGENADFANATPSGELKINIDKGVPAADFFEPGKSYYLFFEEAK